MPPQLNFKEHLARALAPIIVILFFFLTLFLFIKLAGPIPFNISSVTTTKQDNFNVTGEGIVNVKPDVAVIRAGVEANAKTAKDAQDRINQTSNALIEAVKALGVADADIKTENYNIYPEYLESNQVVPETRSLAPAPAVAPAVEKPVVADSKEMAVTMVAPAEPIPAPTLAPRKDGRILNYRASSTLVIKVRDMNKANDVLDAAGKTGANVFGGVSFEVDDRTKAEGEAREKAIADAKKKADQAAKAGGFKLGRLINYYEDNGGVRPYAYDTMKALPASGGGNESNIQPGSSEIRVTVTLSYEIM